MNVFFPLQLVPVDTGPREELERGCIPAALATNGLNGLP